MPSLVSSAGKAAVVAFFAAAGSVSAQTFTPFAFGPLGADLPGGQYVSRVIDISGDGLTYIAQLNNGNVLWRTPGGDYTFSGGSPFGLSRDGQTVAGGTSGQNPQRWNLVNAVGNNVAAQTITWPGGPIAYGPAYNVNSNGTVFATATQSVIITASGATRAQPAFQAINQFASTGAFRGLAADAPIAVILASVPGNPTNAYRWNFGNGTIQPYNMPVGATSIEVGSVGASLSADGMRAGGYATIGLPSLPYWWDADGTPHAVSLPGMVAGSMIAMNYPGTLGGGSMSLQGVGARAYLTALDSGVTFNLHNIYSAAGLLPPGWTLLHTQHISDDGSRIFCLATAPDGSQRSVMLTGEFMLPSPGAAAVFGLAGIFASRRRR